MKKKARFSKQSSLLYWLAIAGVVFVGFIIAYKQFPDFFKKIQTGVENKFFPSGQSLAQLGDTLSFNDDVFKNKEKDFTFAIIADSHGDETYYSQILKKIVEEKPAFIIHLGDLVSAGSTKDLQSAKNLLEGTGLKYYTVCGNHDHNFWPMRTTKNYQQVFGNLYYTFNYGRMHAIVLNNSSDSIGIDEAQMNWLKGELNVNSEKLPLTFIFLHIPPSHPFFTHVMGEESDEVATQAQVLLGLSLDYRIDELFAGHIHNFGRYTDKNSSVNITTIPASGSDRTISPGYVLVTVYTDNAYQVQEKFLE